ncbi:GNAT family N-acetyltransferase [Desulfosporosinus sp. PR]|uniref:GNAT family N-acetyltransferase n=1 Tax=Candidatus Desulfosporosinus nitrosoreducens TaxID=3401928 RepID=UPI0027FF9DEC|nr:GNAT family N-acetyltransferase [Desulfosporosinus sp. PR]MDQ7096858.1 GNAT family N-acetyltransferase [Desulfosporosinus sp. PR]
MLTIQDYKDEYQHEIIKMILKIQQEEYNLSITEKDQPDLVNIPAFYQQDNGNFWVAIDCGLVVGTIALKNIGDEKAVLRKMFVKQEYRGKEKGVAKELLSRLLDWAKQEHFREIFLGTTLQFLAAHKFYEKNGFREIKKENLPVNFPVMEVDKKFYYYEL